MSYVNVDPIEPTRLDVVITRGCDHVLTFILTDKNGRPVDLSTSSVKFTARDAFGGTAKIATITNASGAHVDAANGKTAFTVAKTDIDGEANTASDTLWVYEVRRVTAASKEYVHIFGELRIKPAVTAG